MRKTFSVVLWHTHTHTYTHSHTYTHAHTHIDTHVHTHTHKWKDYILWIDYQRVLALYMLAKRGVNISCAHKRKLIPVSLEDKVRQGNENFLGKRTL